MWIYQMRVFLKKHHYPNNGLSAPFPFEWVTGSLCARLDWEAGSLSGSGTQVASPCSSCCRSELAQWQTELVQTDDHPPITRLVLTCSSELNTWASISCCVFSHWSLVFRVFDEVAKSLKLRTIPSIQGSAAHLLNLPGMGLTDGDDGVAPGPGS